MNVQTPMPGGDLLIVDDAPATLKLLANLFKDSGLKVRLAANGRMALESAQRRPPNLVLLDIGMPQMDGYEVCAAFKADPALKWVPIIFISARDAIIDKTRAFNAGCVDYVTKPFHIEEVEARVRTHLTLRQQQRDLQESYDKLRELEALRDGLVHMIVHDLRSPLMALNLSLASLKRTLTLAGVAENASLRFAERATTDLVAMANQLLDISRLEAGQMPIRKHDGDVVETVTAAFCSLSELAGARRVSFQAPTTGLPAPHDPELVSRVVSNLLANAYRHTPAGGEVVLTVAEQHDAVRISVSDTGEGIAPEYQSRIFEKFSVMDLRQKGVGAGLGLAFCKLAVEAHGGRIGLESTLGHGSTFWFTVPAGPAPGQATP